MVVCGAVREETFLEKHEIYHSVDKHKHADKTHAVLDVLFWLVRYLASMMFKHSEHSTTFWDCAVYKILD